MTKDVDMGMRATVAALTSLLILTACGGSNNRQSSATVPVTPTGATATTAPTTPATTAQTASTSTSPTTTSSAGTPPPCLTSDFELRFLGQAGATGHGELGFALRNVSGHQCRTFGYPGILFLDKSGYALPTRPTHTTVDFFGKTTETELVVLPGASVSFRLGVNHGAGNPSGCTTSYGLQVIAPNDTHTTRTTIPQGANECGGDATVSPLQPSTLAFGQ
jgi:hypothetical protein